MTESLRQSVPTAELERYYHCGWAYVMPNFDKPNHSWVEWLSEKMPVYPCVKPEINNLTNGGINAKFSGCPIADPRRGGPH
jgi:hypothetical protein